MRLLLFILAFTATFQASAQYADSFIITHFDKGVKVVSPAKEKEIYSIIIENKGSKRFVGKIESDKTIYSLFTVKPNESHSFKVDFKPDGPLRFMSLAPAFDTINFKFGNVNFQ